MNTTWTSTAAGRRTGIGVVALGLVLAAMWPARAHEGHGSAPTTPVFGLDAPRSVSPQVARVIGLKTAEVDFGRVERVLRLTGTVEAVPDRVRAIAPRLSGVIADVKVRVGDAVKKGDVLVEIDSPELAQLYAQIAQAQSRTELLAMEAKAADALAKLSETELARLEANAQGVAANTLSERRVAALMNRTAERTAQLELDQSKVQLAALERVRDARLPKELALMLSDGRVELLAPIDGVVTARDAVIGRGVSEGAALLTIADHSSVQIEAELPESLAERLGAPAGQSVRLRRDPAGAVLATGTVRFLSPAVDPVKRTTHVLVDAPNPAGALRAGMFVDATIVLSESDDAVVVPASAVLNEGPVTFVFIKERRDAGGEIFVKRDIVPGQRSDAMIEVLDGLVPGDVVVTQGAYSLTQMRPANDGAPASAAPKPARPSTPAPSPAPAHNHSGHSHPG